MWYWLFRTLFFFIFKIFFRFSVTGLSNIPGNTNLIIAVNHCSYLDAPLISAALPFKIHWVSARYLYKTSWMRWFLDHTGALKVGRSSENIINLLEAGETVGIFPEGLLSADGKLKEFRTGVAVAAYKTGRAVLPCAVLGTCEALPRNRVFPKFTALKVKVGRPVYLLKELDTVVDNILLMEGILKIRNSIKELLDE